MDFAWTRQQLILKDAIIEFAREHLNDRVIERDRAGEFNREGWLRGIWPAGIDDPGRIWRPRP